MGYFILGLILGAGCMSISYELRDRQREADIYEREYLKRNESVDVTAEDFEQELELHKN